MTSEYSATLLEQRQGLFGQIRVFRDDNSIWMNFDDVMQGGICSDGTYYLPHTQGWVKASENCKDILIIGLGPGEVVKALLNHSPRNKITIIEIDPVVVELALKYFPHLNNTCVEIILADAATYLQNSNRHWEIGLSDAYQKNCLPYLPDDLINALLSHCNNVCVNCLGTPGLIYSSFEKCGRPIISTWNLIDTPILLSTQKI